MKRATCCQPRKRQPSTSTVNGIFHDQLYGKKYFKINLEKTWLTSTILLFSLWSMLDARRRSSTSVNVHFIALFITPQLYYYFLWPQCSCSLPWLSWWWQFVYFNVSNLHQIHFAFAIKFLNKASLSITCSLKYFDDYFFFPW